MSIMRSAACSLLLSSLIISGCKSPQDVVKAEEKPVDDPYSLLDDEEEEEEYFDENVIRFEDYTYKEGIKTVQLYPFGDPLAYPIIVLNTEQRLELHFDELGSDLEQYYYRLYHCNSDWTRSDIIEMQYLDGFFSDVLNNYDMSFNTLVPYVHYSAMIPNESMRLKLSGNYLLVVTENDNEDQPVLTRRFMVVDPKVAIQTNAKQTPVAEDRAFKQLIDFEIHHASMNIVNPFRDIKTVILQNNRWDRAISDLKPIFLRDKILEYRYDRGNDFWAGNEFRQFNISSTRYVSENVAAIYREGDKFVAELNRDYKRNISGYMTFRDINGRYVTRNVEGFGDLTESDYLDVKFTLADQEPRTNGDFYIFGGLSEWRVSPEFKLRYNEQKKVYERNVLLKQGFYEYHYVFVKDMSDFIDETVIEGSYFETENDYTILVYYRDISDDYDRLIGAYTFTTRDRF